MQVPPNNNKLYYRMMPSSAQNRWNTLSNVWSRANRVDLQPCNLISRFPGVQEAIQTSTSGASLSECDFEEMSLPVYR